MKTVLLFLTTFYCAFLSFGLMGNILDETGGQSKKNVKFKLIKTFGAEEKPVEALLSNVTKITTDNKGNLYVIEKGRLLSFKPDGTLSWVNNKKGQGPGDINNPYGITTDGEKYLYIDNVSLSRIDKFDLNGKYINSTIASNIKLGLIQVVGFVKPNFLVVMQYPKKILGADISVLEIGATVKIKKHFIVNETGDIKLYNNPGIWVNATVNGNSIATGNYAYYRINEYDINGKQVRTIKRDFRKLVIFSGKKGIGTYSVVSPPFRISKSYFLCGLSWPKNADNLEQLFGSRIKREFNNMIDIFDERGNLIYSVEKEGKTNPEIGNPIYSDPEGYLYTFKEMPYPQICKYQVIIEDKK